MAQPAPVIRRVRSVAKERPRSVRRAADEGPNLVRAARAGDKEAFAELHRRYRGMVHAVLLVRVGHPEADDLLQDTFVTAWIRLGDLRDVRSFGPWLQTIARTKATDALRSRRTLVPLSDDHREVAVRPRLPVETAQALAAIRRLPTHLAEPLSMRLVEGLTGPEIAELTGLTHGSVRVTLHRAMKRLRAELESSDA